MTSLTTTARVRLGCLCAALLLATIGSGAQPGPDPGTFRELRPPQQALVSRWVSEYQAIFKKRLDPEATYNHLPMSARTTFQAVTHALLTTTLSTEDDKPMGTALDLVDFVERVSGRVPGTRGDHQFRLYVYLKPGALNRLYTAKEFRRGRDNTVFHIGYPINFRQQGGVPSIQFSIARTGRRADIDVDYRSSSAVKALVNGHLTAANSDVRAGQNGAVHNRRWNGLSTWWKDLLAAFVEDAPEEETTEGLTPGADAERRKFARGPLPDAIRSYLTNWLIDRKPEELLPLVSIKAYPCVSELGGDARPDSKLALVRILRSLQEQNEALGAVDRLEDVVTSVPYPLPQAEPVRHPFEHLFSLQRVPDDVAWAIDCRVRYKMQLAESIPRPPHRLASTYVASMRIKDRSGPGAFLVQTWEQESGEWRLVSFDIKRHSTTPPRNLLAAAEVLPAAGSDEAAVSSEAQTLTTTWLIERRSAETAAFFLPESYACDPYAGDDTVATRAAPATDATLKRFLEEAAAHAVPNQQLEGVIAAAAAAHPDMKPVPHERGGAFLLVRVTGDLQRMSACGADARAGAPETSAPRTASATGLATIFRLVEPDGQSGAAITLNWKKAQDRWRVASYAVTVD